MEYVKHPALAPIRALLTDPQITEIMINGTAGVFVERGGVMGPTPVRLTEQQLNQLVGAMLQPSGRDVSASTPFADFRLPDGSRGNITIPPVSLVGPVITIRKFTKTIQQADDLVRVGTLSPKMAHTLALAVRGRANIIFAGATGTGKTTTLNALSRHIPPQERIISIEDTAELQLQQPHVVRLECRHANLEGRGAITLAQLLRNALRMRPTRIIVGEVRGEEATDMIQAISTGHQGCLAVLHASSPLDAVSRLEMMLLSRGLMLPLWAIHRQIASAIDLVVQHELLVDGTRKITYVTEVAGVEGDRVSLRDLFVYGRVGADQSGREIGRWTCAGHRPRFADRCERQGIVVPPELYAPGAE